MEQRKKILYLMHIPWGWIKQRPHFFAELLSIDFDVDVFYKKPTIVSKKDLLTLVDNKYHNLSVRGFRYLPFEQIPVLRHLHCEWINTFLLIFQLPSFKKYDFIWVTSPLLYSVIRFFCKKDLKIIYDCMDDVLEFPAPKTNRVLYNKLLKNEIKLLEISQFVISSAEYLKHKILKRATVDREIVVVNNAIALPDEHLIDDSKMVLIKKELEKFSFVLMYIGAISEWFDFETVLYSLENNSKAHVVLFGPADVAIPTHERVHYMGTIERKYIFTIMSFANVLIMPFKVNELIRSVNPVKIYEYIYAAKFIIVSKYEETEKFSKFVSFYTTKEDFSTLISGLAVGEKECLIDKDEMKAFALANTWNFRYKLLRTLLQ
ncbi:hypothetical protein [uncultured Bacteroides sp.]|jgi:glycosyltransferase, family 1|uniref:hypothetical protein n=1 Tax=uncultured Bacteroides sp. TaxID=162156 RepID=UPI00260589A6|nr:hypothetical protein [uncultured Bacteroides sp.]